MLMFLYYIGGQAARGRRQIRRVQGKHALPLFIYLYVRALYTVSWSGTPLCET